MAEKLTVRRIIDFATDRYKCEVENIVFYMQNGLYSSYFSVKQGQKGPELLAYQDIQNMEVLSQFPANTVLDIEPDGYILYDELKASFSSPLPEINEEVVER